MFVQNILKTALSKAGILTLNFAIVVCTTQFWGAEGKGIISIVIADLSIIVILNNIFSSSSISYYTSRININNVIIPAYAWILSISVIASLFFWLVFQHNYFFYLLILTIITSLTTFNLAVFIGKEKLSIFNIYSLLIPLLTLVLMLIFRIFSPKSNVVIYFWGYGFANLFVWIFSLININLKLPDLKKIDWVSIKSIYNYGWKNELSSLLQFFNYRFTYFIMLYYMGIIHVGIFSVGIAIAESIWIISKSLSLVLYSKIINTSNPQKTIVMTNKLAIISAIITFGVGIIIVLIPGNWFSTIFGKDFSQVKHITVLLYPGILFISFSNIYGHFLAATGQQKPLVLKSVYGLITTLLLSYILIPKYGIDGACITNVLSHFISSLYIYFTFLIKNKITNKLT